MYMCSYSSNALTGCEYRYQLNGFNREVLRQKFYSTEIYFLPLLRRFNPAEPVVEKSVIL